MKNKKNLYVIARRPQGTTKQSQVLGYFLTAQKSTQKVRATIELALYC